MKLIKSLAILSFFIYADIASAQTKDFSEWEATAYCSYSHYHPFTYIEADNNWEIMQRLRTAHTRQYLDSIGVKNTDSQMMLLSIEGLIQRVEGNCWKTVMPLLDSLQTVEARTFSLKIARELYEDIKSDCSELVTFLQKERLQENAYSILFSYVLDGKVWEAFSTFEELKTSATWDGECWALYFQRPFSCGTNTYYDKFCMNWTEQQPDFIWEELHSQTFIKPFLTEYEQYGKIISNDLLIKAFSLGMVYEDGTLHIPVIDSKNTESELNILSDRIIKTIVHHFTNSDIISAFQTKFCIDEEKLTRTILYHEVMWDLMDLLTIGKIIHRPTLWENADEKLTYSVIYIQK